MFSQRVVFVSLGVSLVSAAQKASKCWYPFELREPDARAPTRLARARTV